MDRPVTQPIVPLHLLMVALLCTQFLVGCGSATRSVRNEKAEVKDLKAYRDVYVLAFDKDPRAVMPKVVAQFQAMGLNVNVVDSAKLSGAQGTGFVISAQGHVLTCAHLFKEEKAATLRIQGRRYEADLVTKDDDKDLALLKIRDVQAAAFAPLSFRSDGAYGIGADVFTIGFPLSNVLGSGIRYSRGTLSSMTGLRDDPKQLQFSAQIQPGSSGGPLFDKDGVVIGVIQQTLNPLRTLQQTGGALPQNVNFAIKTEIVLDYLRSTDKDLYAATQLNKGRGVEELQKSVVKVRAGLVTDEWETTPKLVARVSYQSIWDLWYRFRYFVVRVYDFDTQDLLLVAGQDRDNMISDEDVVIRDTFAQVRKILER